MTIRIKICIVIVFIGGKLLMFFYCREDERRCTTQTK